MLRNIVAIEHDGLDTRVLTIICEVPNAEFDITSAAKAAATKFCLTDEGRQVYEHNCEQFNWADFETNVPASICEKYGFKVVDTALNDVVVDWDEHLVDDSVLGDLEDENEIVE